MITITIQGSVGLNGDNNPNDVIAIKTRLIELGFDWLTADESLGQITINTIKLFQAIINGDNYHVNRHDGRVDVEMQTHTWLQAINAPRWTKLPAGSREEGFVNDKDVGQDNDHGTNWLMDTIIETGRDYQNDFLKNNPKAALLTTNESSGSRGGFLAPHQGHQSGLAYDIRLPRKDGGAGGGIHVGNSAYDRNAMRAIIRAFLNQELASRVFLIDDVLIGENLCIAVTGHDNHAHFEIVPPKRVMD